VREADAGRGVGRIRFRMIDPRRIEVIDDATAAVLRRMSPVERVRRGLGMGDFARRTLEAGVRHAHPGWDEQHIKAEALRRFVGG
jgi:hypothetical protein